eukprot:189838-Chlamydomonas_euryale.AAC.6
MSACRACWRAPSPRHPGPALQAGRQGSRAVELAEILRVEHGSCRRSSVGLTHINSMQHQRPDI